MKTRTKKIVITVLIIDLVLLGGYWYLHNEIKSTRERAVAFAQDLDFEIRKERKLKSTEKIIEDTKEAREELAERFVSDDEIVDFIQMIESLGTIADISVEVINVSVSNIEEKDLEELSMDLEAQGSWGEVTHFISLVETLPFKVWSSRMSLSQDTEGDEVLGWVMDLEIRVIKLPKE